MIVNPKTGIDQLIFGMKKMDVSTIYGNPDKQFEDDEKNEIWLYNDKKLRLTFYEDEAFKLGYIISSNPNLELFSNKVINQEWNIVEKLVLEKGIKSLEKDTFDSVDNFFNESNWMTFQVEFGQIIKIELGATFDDKDEFDFKFKSK